MTFTFIDLVFTILILFFAILGAINGFVKEIFSKISIILSVFLALTFASSLSPVFQSLIENKTVDLVLAFLVIFVASFLLIKILQAVLENIFSMPILKSLDSTLGFAFGLLQGLFIVASFLIIALAQPWFDFSSVGESSLYYNILKGIIDTPILKIKEFVA